MQAQTPEETCQHACLVMDHFTRTQMIEFCCRPILVYGSPRNLLSPRVKESTRSTLLCQRRLKLFDRANTSSTCIEMNCFVHEVEPVDVLCNRNACTNLTARDDILRKSKEEFYLIQSFHTCADYQEETAMGEQPPKVRRSLGNRFHLYSLLPLRLLFASTLNTKVCDKHN